MQLHGTEPIKVELLVSQLVMSKQESFQIVFKNVNFDKYITIWQQNELAYKQVVQAQHSFYHHHDKLHDKQVE